MELLPKAKKNGGVISEMNACIILLMVAIATLCSGCGSVQQPNKPDFSFPEADELDMTLHETDKLGMDLHQFKLRILQLHEGMDLNSVKAILKPIRSSDGTGISGMNWYSLHLSDEVFVNLEFTSKDILVAKPDTLMVITKPLGQTHWSQVRLSQIK